MQEVAAAVLMQERQVQVVRVVAVMEQLELQLQELPT
jgi:hypothetical protein